MPDNNQNLDSYKKTLQKFTNEEVENKDKNENSKIYDGVYLFIAYDLVNSTAFKTESKEKWLTINKRFYNLVHSELANNIKISTWRYLGDEVIFYKKVFATSELFEYTYKAFDVMKTSIKNLEREYEDVKNCLSIKSCLWIADVQYCTKDENNNSAENIISYFENNTIVDFLGIDIDTGFRIKNYSHKNIMVISADLAYILNEYHENSLDELLKNNMRIVSYEKLNGVWNDRYYPIIWYYNDWENIDKCFYYDDKFDNNLVKNAINKPEGTGIIKNIFYDLNKVNKINNIIKSINYADKTYEHVYQGDFNKFAEVHCVAVCFNQNGSILFVKRPSSKSFKPNTWEFGCSQLKFQESIEDCIKNEYNKSFGINLNIYNDSQNNPIPIKTYKIPNRHAEQEVRPGFIFIAEIEGESDLSLQKHESYKWVNPNDLKAFNENEFVSTKEDIEDTISRAKKAYEIWRNNE